MSKLTKIIEISELTNSDKISIWTNSFKVSGKLYKDKEKLEKGIVSIESPSIKPFLPGCEPESTHDWLNIFEDQIIAFTIIK